MCRLENLARRFIESLNLPYHNIILTTASRDRPAVSDLTPIPKKSELIKRDGLLKRDGHICYCDECKTYYGSAGFTDYNYPVDWYFFRVNVRVPPGKTLEEISNKWDLCFHGTEVAALESVLRLGLRIPGDTDFHGRPISELPGHINENNGPHGYDTKRIFVSPSIWYAGSDSHARPRCYKSKKSGLTYLVKVALMVRICPGAYIVSGSTMETWFTIYVDAWGYPKDIIEWSTKQRESVVISGLLVKFERYECIGIHEKSCSIF